MEFETTLRSPVFDFVKKNLPFSPNKMTKIEVTTVNDGISYNYNVFFFFINRNITINTYFVKMLLKAILKMSYNTYTRVDTAFERG